MSADNSIERLRRLKDEALMSGGPERIAARRRRGAASARQRVAQLLDAGTFVELDVFIPGVVTGHGKIDGRDVYVFSEDGENAQAPLNDVLARKMAKVVDLAVKNGVPLVGFYDGGRGGDGEEGKELSRYSELYFRNVMASGLIPQIAAVMGPCTGAAVFSPALADVVIMVKGAGRVFLGDPVTDGGEAEVALEETGGARAHSEKSGLVHLAADGEADCLELIRTVLAFLPQNNLEEPPRSDLSDLGAHKDAGVGSLRAVEPGRPYDVRDLLGDVVDRGDFLELSAGWGRNMVVGFARLGGRSVGIVCNQPAHLEGAIDIDAASKAARFIRLCDAFNVPVVTLVDTPGFVSGKNEEHRGVVRAAAKLMYAYCEATVPKVTVVTRRGFGEGFEVMGSKGTRADFNFAWPAAEIEMKMPIGILDRQDSGSPYEAAAVGYLDDVIEPVETRARLMAALEACASKREGRPPKKHGNIPL